MKPLRWAAALALLTAGAAAAVDLDPEQDARYKALLPELRCLVCQNQSLAESEAPLAADLREEVREQLAAGKSDAEIKQYLTDRYGDFVLYRPRFAARTWLLWLGPFLLLAVGIAVVVGFVRRSRKAADASPAVDSELLHKILDDKP